MEINKFVKDNNSTEKYKMKNISVSIIKKTKRNIDFLDLIIPYKPYEYRLKRYKQRRVAVERLSYEPDLSAKFNSSMQYSSVEKGNIPVVSKSVSLSRNIRQKKFEREMCEIYGVREIGNIPDEPIKLIPSLDYVDWEKQIDVCNEKRFSDSIEEKVMVNEFVEGVINGDIWEDQIFHDERYITKFNTHLILRTKDPSLIYETVERKKIRPKRKKEIFNGEKPLKSKYNLSNDKYYFTEISNKSNLGTLGVQHSSPALNLDLYGYKTFLTKEELRNFHRPKIELKNGQKIIFKNCEPDKQINVLNKIDDLSLKYDCEFNLFEYSEEIPPLLSNIGMVSLLTKFYRKTGFKDDTNLLYREQFNILDVEDPSPFMGFGEVQPGQTIDALTNNLYKAPVFKHTVDLFMCILPNNNSESKGYIRKINHIYCVGQTLPLEEVFSPHSRKLNIYCKNRLKIEAYKLFKRKNTEKNKKKEMEMLKITELDELFPYFSEGSKRKWLKEYADCLKKGKDNVWVLKETASLLSDEDLRKLVTPENVCQYESMLATEQRLRDSGYELDDSEDEEGEIGLSAWCLTRNFVNASNGKGILELSGPGDPTGIGEGFSFVRVRQKKGDENRKFTNEAMIQYKEEINAIWNRQKESLSSAKEVDFQKPIENKDSDAQDKSEEFIIIKRYIKRHGIIEIEEEKVNDHRVIDLYLKNRSKLKVEDKRSFLKCGSCGQTGHMKTNKSCPNFIGPLKSTKKRIETERRQAKNYLIDLIINTIKKLSSINYSAAFLRPVSIKKFPNYPQVISNPIDLGTMKSKARQFKYKNFQMFIDDMILMKENCIKFNGHDHSLTKVADEMLFEVQELYDEKKTELEEIESLINLEN